MRKLKINIQKNIARSKIKINNLIMNKAKINIQKNIKRNSVSIVIIIVDVRIKEITNINKQKY